MKTTLSIGQIKSWLQAGNALPAPINERLDALLYLACLRHVQATGCLPDGPPPLSRLPLPGFPGLETHPANPPADAGTFLTSLWSDLALLPWPQLLAQVADPDGPWARTPEGCPITLDCILACNTDTRHAPHRALQAMTGTLLLADYAQAIDNTLYIQGGGKVLWETPTIMALALRLQVPWTETNRRHVLRFALYGEDGRPAKIGDDAPYEIHTAFEIGRPAGSVPGEPLPMLFTFTLQDLTLQPASAYCWQASTGDDDYVVAQESFRTLPHADETSLATAN